MMKLTVQVKLTPDAAQAPVLERTLVAINEAANQVSQVAYATFGLRASTRGLRSLCYGDLKAQGFGAQVAQHVIKRVVDAYTTLRANIRAGNLGPQGSQRRRKAESKPIAFGEHAAHTMDDRCLSKRVVAVAQRTTRGIALEELQGIRGRVTVPGDQRARLSSWPFHQLGGFLAYKAQRAGVPLIEVDPAYTSQTCPNPWWGRTGRGNCRTRDDFCCRRCGFAGPSDEVAAVNVRTRARRVWAFPTMPTPDPA